jgi:serine phosphatase RsbU (regulator of sigma subunit)
MPDLRTAEIALVYEQARIGGDFFDCVAVGPRLVFVLLDIAGRRGGAMHVAAAVQDVLRGRAPDLFRGDEVNESHALIDLVVEVNRTVLRVADAVRCTPGFIGCYNEVIQTIFFVNAGAVPALLRDASGVTELPATGLPLGLFSHATHDPQIRAVQAGAALVAVTRGVIEVHGPRREEFGVSRLKEAVTGGDHLPAQALCASVLASVKSFAELPAAGILDRWINDDPLAINDRTVVALKRNS